MKSNITKLSLLALLAAILLAACGGGGTPESDATDIPVVVDNFDVIAEGRLVPADSASLSFPSGGRVLEILVEEGESVNAGDPLARLSNFDQLRASVASAEAERVSAQQALDDLVDNADLAAAETLKQIADARDAIRDAERKINNLNYGSREVDINSAQAQVVILRDKLEDAEEDYEPYADKPENNLTRAGFLSKLADAQRSYDDAVRILNNRLAAANDIDLALAEAELAIAEAQLAVSENNYEEVKDGPDPDLLANSEARLDAAEASLAAAEAALAEAQLTTPIDGTVVEVDIKIGEQAAPGEPAVVVADFSAWEVETDNLTEIEVPQISVGQVVSITPDALPELDLAGTVISISDLFEEKRGDVTYTTVIELDEVDERLRWGMTVVVTFLQ
ncbi:MAG: HlyD family efflux transporter periplasmic adaptor subunit [Chloroflexi bacterium]|nr:MAG: HlyD family efflux transporter periplasmic adaptor subunit [Chloroflexota bacterium]MBL1192986.1 HlyD family efflux transporter periplasmic adaptor subunit [Chloroflexota bacterium]NOH10278.1 HlyD family efflux transporter periplasmic adaptor subunit [Chloroflexota bacterium]